MTSRRMVFRVLRSRPGAGEEPRHEELELEVTDEATVLDALERLRVEREPGLLYRHSCHHGSCGTCGMRIDGMERLACLARLDELGPGPVTVEPLRGLRREGDLVVEMHPLFRDVPEGWSSIRGREGTAARTRLEDCIECGLCYSACPEADRLLPFRGPAALAAIQRRIEAEPGEEGTLLALAGDELGVRLCRRSIDCSRRCPTGVFPARRIADLAGRLARKRGDD